MPCKKKNCPRGKIGQFAEIAIRAARSSYLGLRNARLCKYGCLLSGGTWFERGVYATPYEKLDRSMGAGVE